jgi:hypothetical protein
MTIDNRLIQATIERYKQRELQRTENIKKIGKSDLFSIDIPARVEQRLARIASSPLAQITLAEDRQMSGIGV